MVPKNVEDLAASRERRQEIIRELGLGRVPTSILLYDKTDKAMDLLAAARSDVGDRGGHTGKLGEAFMMSSQSGRRKGGRLSLFPQNIGRMLLKLYTKESDVVLDPFAGHNSRMQLCHQLRRHYYGSDCSKQFMQANREIKALLQRDTVDMFAKDSFRIELHEGDSRKLPWPDGFADFTITSPPYWDLEYYGDEKEQLGTGRKYDEFLGALTVVMQENYRCLKKGAFCCWFVNDFRKSIFFNYHGHVIDRMTFAGFNQHDIAIVDLGVAIKACFASQVIKDKIIPKRHEYCLVFKK